ncbi:glycosyl transferase family 1 [Parazoarcus communis]|uniref:Glycosyl transferase family 1 n=1 Tax=Parazoarcus communis TaxID=41977 RepID=A0A2U8GX57_9RHOO|nr:glycosyltransferase [Parazoarcus communis]AWI77025.1 glycosyl transferase family 1 [Parazoarcus communis]
MTAAQALPQASEAHSEHLPCIAIFSTLFPSSIQPNAGLFIRERMFRMGRHAPLIVVAPQPWFPLQSLIRHFKPGYRPMPPRQEVQEGVTVLFPRFLAVPGLFRRLDGLSMALCTFTLMRRLRKERQVGIIDAHFAYPCGDAATRLGRWLKLPVTITLRGTESRHLADPALKPRVLQAVTAATRVFSVSDSLRQLMIRQGVSPEHISVVGNGVDLAKFRPISKLDARLQMAVPDDAPILISVGGLVERKGFHRVIELLPALLKHFPRLHYLVVGGPSPEGDMSVALREQVRGLGLEAHVTFTGSLPPDRLHVPLSAADVFVLPTRNEGWANVFLEAMACGLPVVTTDVGGNPEVINSPALGQIVPFGNASALEAAITAALENDWDRERIVQYAHDNTWDKRIDLLVRHFHQVLADYRAPN